jgi:hypothetical protein
MKNTIKLFGIIALVAVIGLALSGCEEEKEPMLKVVNQSNRTILSVKLGGYSWGAVPAGESRTFAVGTEYNNKYGAVNISYPYGNNFELVDVVEIDVPFMVNNISIIASDEEGIGYRGMESY